MQVLCRMYWGKERLRKKGQVDDFVRMEGNEVINQDGDNESEEGTDFEGASAGPTDVMGE